MKNFIQATALCLLIGLSTSIQAKEAPNWQLPWLSGGKISLEELKGKVVLMDFWASWCVPCRTSMPALKQMQEEFAEQDVVILPVTVDDDLDDANAFLKRFGEGLRSVHDANGDVAAAYELPGMPTSFVIDRNGQIVLRHEGFRKGDEDDWRKAIRAALSSARP